MVITRQLVADKLGGYLRGTISLPELVDWAESAVCDGEFDPAQGESLAAVVARLGVADVRAFGLTWEECRDILHTVGVRARIDLAAA